MRIALLILAGLFLGAVVIYYFKFPRGTFISFYGPGGSAVTFSRTSISFAAAPEHYATNGFSHIDSYVPRLLAPSERLKFLNMFTPDGTRGFSLNTKDGKVQALLTIEWRQESQKEAAVRAFFNSLGIAPSEDYLGGNGGVPDATRVLSYPVVGSAEEMTALAKRILKELCGVSPSEGLDISLRNA